MHRLSLRSMHAHACSHRAQSHASHRCTCRVFEDPDFWVYFQPITLYNALAQRRVSSMQVPSTHCIPTPIPGTQPRCKSVDL